MSILRASCMHKINLAKLIMRKDLWEPVGGSDPKTVIDND